MKQFFIVVLFLSLSLAILVAMPVFAKNSYDEKAVMAHDVAKIKTLKTNLSLNENYDNEELQKTVEDFLASKNYLKKKKEGIFFVPIDKNNQIKKIYHMKNPEQVMFVLNDNFSEEQLSDITLTGSYFKENLKAKASVIEKIDRIDRNIVRKSTELGVQGIMGLNNITPLNPARGLVNAFFGVFSTCDKEVYEKILKEIELMKDGEKNYKIVTIKEV